MPGLWLSLLLGLCLLVGCIWWSFHDVADALASSIVTTGLDYPQFRGPVFLSRVAWFVAALLALHLAFGWLAYGLARLTAAASPGFLAGRPRLLVTLWFSTIALWAFIVNASWFPSSNFGSPDSWLLRDWLGLSTWRVLSAVLVILIVALFGTVLLRRAAMRREVAVVSSTAIVVVASLFFLAHAPRPEHPAPAFAQPHIVIIGVDSLRDDIVSGDDRNSLVPNISQFVAGAHRFTDTTTPFARTYPSWMSILTGRSPVATNARDNLMPRKLVHEGITLGDALIACGYRSVYATDEVRFANFDESFGFVQVITPQIGLSDFILGKAGDLPLHNLLLDTPVGAWLFPANYANRAVHVTYRPRQFVGRLRRELIVDRPMFLALHLTLSHWPYSWAGLATPTVVQEYRAAYRRSVQEVDRQFGDVLETLRSKGVLENAVVVLLSDHGEAMGGETDTMLRKTGTGIEIWNSIWGHGTSVMSPHQYGVLFAMRSFGRGVLPGTAGAHDWPVSLEDIRPTLEEIVTGRAPSGFDGLSLLPFLADQKAVRRLEERIRFTETGFSPNRVLAGHYGSAGLIREGIEYFDVVPETGWVQLRSNRLGELMAQKQRAAMTSDSLLAAIPSWTDDSQTYLFTDRHSPLPRKLTSRPNPEIEPEAARLWDALHAHYAGELGGDIRLP